MGTSTYGTTDLQAIKRRTQSEYYTGTAATAASTITFNQQSKAILVVNEGANPCRIHTTGGTPTSTVGVLLAAGASYSNQDLQTESIGIIRTGAVDTTVRVEVIY